eukprot:CFRG4339T1
MPNPSPAEKLRQLLAESTNGPALAMPCCFDAMSARLIEREGFKVSFMSGFGVSAALLGLPDTQQVSMREMVDTGTNICSSVKIPVIGDGDTGYGNAINIKRTVCAYARAGFAGIMLEDQVAPKRCGHTKGKSVVSREMALLRIKAAADAKKEYGLDIVIVARTDALEQHGIEEAIWRMREFEKLGAEVLFLEAIKEVSEMETFCNSVQGYKMANMIEGGITPVLSQAKLGKIGYSLAAYPITLLSSALQAMTTSLRVIKDGGEPEMLMNRESNPIMTFEEVKTIVGFDEYYAEEKRYS